MDQAFWDDLYTTRDQLWSGAPNGMLVAEASDLAPGRALDLGCGEGGDARWLADRGWQVTAVDISEVALARAKAAGANTVQWTHADVRVTPPAPEAFDLVSAIYFTAPKEPDHGTLRGLLAAVAPGGTLIVGAHDLSGHQHETPLDPADFYTPEEVGALLGEEWTVVTNEIRDRKLPSEDSPHVRDIVFTARRAPAKVSETVAQ